MTGSSPVRTATGSGCREAGQTIALLSRHPGPIVYGLGRRVFTPEKRAQLPLGLLCLHFPVRDASVGDAGWRSSVSRWAHNPQNVGSNPTPATKPPC